MSRFLLAVLAGVMVIICGGTGASAQSYGDLVPGASGTVTFTLDGKIRTVPARAYLTEGRLFIHALWVEDSTVRFGKAGLASTFMLRVKGLVGEYMIGSGSDSPMFSLQYNSSTPPRMYVILRANGEGTSGGSGKIAVITMSDRRAEGAFEVTAFDINNPALTRIVSGHFAVEFKRIGEVAGE